MAESYAPESSVTAVARHYAIMPTQLFSWRREARLALSKERHAGFATMKLDAPVGAGTVELDFGGVIGRAGPGEQVDQLVMVLRAMQAAT